MSDGYEPVQAPIEEVPAEEVAEEVEEDIVAVPEEEFAPEPLPE